MSEGWISLHRKIQDNPLWKSESFTRGQAWVDLLLLANHEPGFFYVRGNKIELERGQCGWSQKRLSERWKWSRTKVRKFLSDLEEEHQIIQHKNNVSTVITIKNYKKYQPEKQQNSHQKDNRKTSEEQQRDTNNNDNNVNNDKKDARGESESLGLDEIDIPESEKFQEYGNQIGMLPDYCQHIYDSLLSRGWRDGRNDNPVRDWRAYLRMKFKYQHSWKNESEDQQKVLDGGVW